MQHDTQDSARPINVTAQQYQGKGDVFQKFLPPELRPFNQNPIDLFAAWRLMDWRSAVKQSMTPGL
jgi:hypothetical protein